MEELRNQAEGSGATRTGSSREPDPHTSQETGLNPQRACLQEMGGPEPTLLLLKERETETRWRGGPERPGSRKAVEGRPQAMDKFPEKPAAPRRGISFQLKIPPC